MKAQFVVPLLNACCTLGVLFSRDQFYDDLDRSSMAVSFVPSLKSQVEDCLVAPSENPIPFAPVSWPRGNLETCPARKLPLLSPWKMPIPFQQVSLNWSAGEIVARNGPCMVHFEKDLWHGNCHWNSRSVVCLGSGSNSWHRKCLGRFLPWPTLERFLWKGSRGPSLGSSGG